MSGSLVSNPSHVPSSGGGRSRRNAAATAGLGGSSSTSGRNGGAGSRAPASRTRAAPEAISHPAADAVWRSTPLAVSTSMTPPFARTPRTLAARAIASSSAPIPADSPRPPARGIERFTPGDHRLLGSAVQQRGVVSQRRAVPEEIPTHVRAGTEIRKPVHAVGVEREVQPVRVPVPAAQRAALEAHVAGAGAQHRKTLRFQQHAAGNPGRDVAGQLGNHGEQRPPRKATAGDRRREKIARGVV